MRPIILTVSLSVFWGNGAATAEEDAPPQDEVQVQFFKAHIRPLLISHCHSCHSGMAKKLRAGLRLDSRAAVLAGGDAGPAIVPGDPDASLLMQAIRYESLEMPPQGKLSPTQLRHVRRWIEMGAPWPDYQTSDAVAEGHSSVADVDFDWQQRRADYWAWQPIQSNERPDLDVQGQPPGPIDRFLLARLREVRLRPSGPTDRRTLARRFSSRDMRLTDVHGNVIHEILGAN